MHEEEPVHPVWLYVHNDQLSTLSNDYCPCPQAPRAVGEAEREVVGNLMTAGYCTGLTLGR